MEANLEDIAKQVRMDGIIPRDPHRLTYVLFIFDKILSVCATVGENPLIRYHRPLDVQGTVNRNIPWHLAKLVQQELDNFCKLNPEFPVSHRVWYAIADMPYA